MARKYVNPARSAPAGGQVPADAPVRFPEQVDLVPAGLGASGEPEYSLVRTGRARRPESAGEWCERRIAALRQFRHMPACAALIALLEAGEDADVKAAGRQLDDWQRHGVLTALGELADAAGQSYPPASALMLRLQAAWRRQWGDRQVIPPRIREVKREPGMRVTSLVADPPGAGHFAAAWGRPPGSA